MPVKHLSFSNELINKDASCFPISLAQAVAILSKQDPFQILDGIVNSLKENISTLNVEAQNATFPIFDENLALNCNYVYFNYQTIFRASYLINEAIKQCCFDYRIIFSQFKDTQDVIDAIRKSVVVEIGLYNGALEIPFHSVVLSKSKIVGNIVLHDPIRNEEMLIDAKAFLSTGTIPMATHENMNWEIDPRGTCFY